MNTNKNTMTDCELQVMKVIWESDKLLTLPEILACVNQKYGKEWNIQSLNYRTTIINATVPCTGWVSSVRSHSSSA